MDKKKAIQTIIHQCNDEDGFLIQLRSWRRFQQDKYGELIRAMKAYRDAIANEATIERNVAGSLQILPSSGQALVTILGDMIEIFPRNEQEQGKIESALAECWELVEVLFMPAPVQAT